MKLSHARTLFDISQVELAKRAGIMQTTISLIEGGHVKPHKATRLRIEKALQQKISWTATGDNQEEFLEKQIASALCGALFLSCNKKQKVVKLFKSWISYLEREKAIITQ